MTAARRKPIRDIPLVALPRHAVADRARPRRRETIRAFVDRTGWERRGLPIIAVRVVNGEAKPVLRAEWGKRISRRDRILFMTMPRGGAGGRSIGALIAMIALIVVANLVAPGIGSAIAGAVGIGSAATWATVATAVIVAGGSLLISHFLKPPSGAKATEDVYSVSLSGNRARPQQPIPVHYGRLKFNPDFASPPWADYQGTTQMFHGLYCLGVGEFEIEEIGIHDTPVWTAEGGVSAGFPNFKYEFVAPDEPVTLFPANVAVSPDFNGQPVPTPYDATNVGPSGETSGLSYLGPFIINGPGTVGKTVAVDVLFPSGCYFNVSSGKQVASGNTTRCEYRYVDDVGVPTSDWAVLFEKVYRFNTTAPVRLTEMVDVPTPGRIQLRIANTEPPTPSAQNVIGGARVYVQGPQTVSRVTRLAIQLVADRQLSQYASQQIYVIATRKIPVWDSGTSTWVPQATTNPLWAAVDMWTSPIYGAGQSASKIDLPAFVSQATAAEERGDAFNFRFTQAMTVAEALETILRSIIAAPVFAWDNLSVVRDEPRTPSLLLTDFEIIRGSAELVYPLADAQTADGTIVEYVEEQTWKRADVPSSDTIAELINPARVQIPGVTKRTQAALIARYLAAVNNYRRETFSCEVEADGKLVRRGSQVIVSTELPMSWGESVRIEDYNLATRTLTLHAPVTWSGSGPWYLRIRRPNGKPWGPVKVTRGAADNIAVIDAADRMLVETQQGVTLAATLLRTVTEEPPTAAFSPASPSEFVGLVSGVANAGEGRFHLTLVVDAPEVYDIDAGSVPALPTTPILTLPGAPHAIDGLHATLKQVSTGLQLSASWLPDAVATTYTAQISLDDGNSRQTVYSGPSAEFVAAGLIPPVTSDILLRVRGESANGIAGPWTQVTLAGVDVVIDSTVADLRVDFENFIGDARHQIELISGLGQGSIAALEQKVNDLTEQIASDAATQAGHSYSQRQLIKVTLGQQVAGAYAAIQTETNIRVTEDQALAELITSLQARMTNAESGLSADASAISSLSTTVTSQGSSISSLSTSYTGLNNRLTTAEGTISSQASAISSLTSNVSSINGTVTSHTESLTSLASRVTTNETNLSTDATAISGLTTSVTSINGQVSSLSTQSSNLDSRLTTAEGNVSGNASAISGLTTNVSSLNDTVSAQASTVSALSTTVSGHTSTLTTYGSSINGLKAEYGVTIEIDGTTGGYVMTGMKKLDGTVTYTLGIRGNVVIDGSLSATKITDLSISTGKVANSAITQVAAYSAATTYYANDAFQQVASFTFSLDAPGNVQIIGLFDQAYPVSLEAVSFYFQLFLDGTNVMSASGGLWQQQATVMYLTPSPIAAGSHTVQVYWYQHNTTVQCRQQTIVVFGAKK